MATLRVLPVINSVLKGGGNLMITHTHSPMFSMYLAEKDFWYALQSANSVKISISTVHTLRGVYKDAIAKGYATDNMTGVIQLFT